jgi:hypothetical protein
MAASAPHKIFTGIRKYRFIASNLPPWCVFFCDKQKEMKEEIFNDS